MVNAARGRPDAPSRIVFDEGHHLFDAADSTFSLALGGQEGVDQIAAAILIEMIEIPIMQPPRSAPGRVNKLGAIGDDFPGRNPGESLASAGHDVRRGRDFFKAGLVIEPAGKLRAEALVSFAHASSPTLRLSEIGS